MVDFKKLSMLSNISRDIVDKEHPSFDENRKRVFCLGFLGGFNYSEQNPDANRETIDAVSRDSMNRSNPWYEEYEKETYLLGFNRGYSYVANDEARHYRQYMENPFSDQIGLGEATPDYDSADAAGLGVQFPILLNGTIIGWLPVDAIYDKDKPNHLVSDDSRYLRMSSVGDSAEIKKEYRGHGYGKAAYYELAVKTARMGMTLCSAPDSSRSENANNLWKSLISSGYARQNGDRYEFINSKLIVTNKAVGDGIQIANKDMADIKDNKFAEKVIGMNQERESIDEAEDDSLLVATNVSLKKDQLKALAVKLFGENASLSLWSYPEVNRVCLGDVPDTITIDGIEIKDGNLKLISDDLGGEIEQSALFWDDVEAISTMLKEVYAAYEKTQKAGEAEDKRPLAYAKAKLFATILEAKKDMGDEISITPTEITENDSKNIITEILPDFESPFEDQNIIGGVSHLKDEDCVHNLALCLENVNDAEALGNAVHEAHVKHLEQGAKQAIHDRIISPSARSFTSEQVEVLNRYHQVTTPDTPVGEVFEELLQEVAQEPDVARLPERWITDTADELDDLAEGITREQGRGMKL